MDNCSPHWWYLSPVNNGVSHAVCKLCGETRDFVEPRIYDGGVNDKSLRPRANIGDQTAMDVHASKRGRKRRPTRYISD